MIQWLAIAAIVLLMIIAHSHTWRAEKRAGERRRQIERAAAEVTAASSTACEAITRASESAPLRVGSAEVCSCRSWAACPGESRPGVRCRRVAGIPAGS